MKTDLLLSWKDADIKDPYTNYSVCVHSMSYLGLCLVYGSHVFCIMTGMLLTLAQTRHSHLSSPSSLHPPLFILPPSFFVLFSILLCGDFDLIEQFTHSPCPSFCAYLNFQTGIQIEMIRNTEYWMPAPGFKDNLCMPRTTLNAANLFVYRMATLSFIFCGYIYKCFFCHNFHKLIFIDSIQRCINWHLKCCR